MFWECDAPPHGDLRVPNKYSKLSDPLGIVVNAISDHFLDDGADFRNYTYSSYGREVLAQPGRFAWQIFDAQTADNLQVDYKMEHVRKATAPTLEELAEQLDGVDAERFIATVRDFNAAIDRSLPYDPARKDGRRTRGLRIDKPVGRRRSRRHRSTRAPLRAASPSRSAGCGSKRRPRRY